MKKLSVSYILWKLVVRLLMLVMVVAFSALLYYILNTGDLGEHVKMTVAAVGARFTCTSNTLMNTETRQNFSASFPSSSAGSGTSCTRHTRPSAGERIAFASCGGYRSGSRKKRNTPYASRKPGTTKSPIVAPRHGCAKCATTIAAVA